MIGDSENSPTAIEIHGCADDANGDEACSTVEFEVADFTSLRYVGNDFVDSVSVNVTFGFDVLLLGNGGDDRLAGPDRFSDNTTRGDVIIFGGEGDDFLGGDRLTGNGGDDFLLGNDRDNYLRGGDGNDTIFGFDGDDTYFGDAGDDILAGSDEGLEIGSRDFIGASRPENFDFTFGNNSFFGGAGDDTIVGGFGEDFIVGGEGNDELRGEPTALPDDSIAQINIDLLSQGGADRLFGNEGDDTIRGGPGDDRIVGGLGIDDLHGDLGNDVVFGSEGNDTINGGTGNDTVFGGDGDDSIREVTSSLNV